MKTKTLAIALFTLTQGITLFGQAPLAPVKSVTDDYFGHHIIDDYRYMENMEDTIVLDWMRAQSDYAQSILNRIPGRQDIINRLIEFDKRKSTTISYTVITENDRYFYLKQSPEEKIAKLYYRDGVYGAEELLFDPDTFNPEDGIQYVINATNEMSQSLFPNNDGSKIAFGIAKAGSENPTIICIEVLSKIIYDERIGPCLFTTCSWLADGESFLYHKINSEDLNDPNRWINTKAYLHKVGTDSKQDRVVLSNEDYPELQLAPFEIPFVVYHKYCNKLTGLLIDGSYDLKVIVADGSDLFNQKINWKVLFSREDEIREVKSDSSYFYAITSKNASNLKIIKVPITAKEKSQVSVVVPETEDAMIDKFAITENGIYFTLLKNGVEAKLNFLENGTTTGRELELPFEAGGISLNTKGINHEDLWVTIDGWTKGKQRYRYLPEANKFQLENLVPKPEYPEFEDLIVEELTVASHDGELVPLSLIYKKDLKKDGTNPTLVWGYGSHGFTFPAFFNPTMLLLPEDGGILAVAHVRGGGEKGTAWHLAGMKSQKPNTWKDMIACVEYLHENKYTSPQKTAIIGGSAGGILIGMTMIERPELYAACISRVGVMNPLRFEHTPAGPVNISEFGTASIEIESKALVNMDPYVQLKKGIEYPPILLTAGMNDPRVVPWQPGKFAARMQAYNSSDNPVLFLVDYEMAHSIGNTKEKHFEETANYLSFALWHMGHPKFQIK